MKFTDNAKLRAVANTSRDNIVINKPVMVKNTGNKKGEKDRKHLKAVRNTCTL